jgi:hypothetical protein
MNNYVYMCGGKAQVHGYLPAQVSSGGGVGEAGTGPPPYLAKSWPMSAKAFSSMALPLGSWKNMVACSPGWPLKRT